MANMRQLFFTSDPPPGARHIQNVRGYERRDPRFQPAQAAGQAPSRAALIDEITDLRRELRLAKRSAANYSALASKHLATLLQVKEHRAAETRTVLEKWRPIREQIRREAARRAAARANQSPSLRRSPRRQGRDLHGSFRAAASSSAAADDDEGLDVDEPDTDAKPE